MRPVVLLLALLVPACAAGASPPPDAEEAPPERSATCSRVGRLVAALLLLLGCAGAADDVPSGPSLPVADAGAPVPADMNEDAAPTDAGAARAPTTCCRLTNERGELVSQQCSSGPLNLDYYEQRGFRCYLVP